MTVSLGFGGRLIFPILENQMGQSWKMIWTLRGFRDRFKHTSTKKVCIRNMKEQYLHYLRLVPHSILGLAYHSDHAYNPCYIPVSLGICWNAVFGKPRKDEAMPFRDSIRGSDKSCPERDVRLLRGPLCGRLG